MSQKPTLDLKSWTNLSISISTPVSFSGKSGSTNIVGPVMVDSMSHHLLSSETTAKAVAYRKWYSVRGDGTNPIWSVFSSPVDSDHQWSDILYTVSEVLPTIEGSTLYKKYTGTDHIVIDTLSKLTIEKPKYLFYDNLAWKSSVVVPT